MCYMMHTINLSNQAGVWVDMAVVALIVVVVVVAVGGDDRSGRIIRC